MLKTEVVQDARSVGIRLELPDLGAQNMCVLVVNHVLIVEGTRTPDREQDGDDFIKSEFAYGRFFKEVLLPISPDSARVDAQYDGRVLTVGTSRMTASETDHASKE